MWMQIPFEQVWSRIATSPLATAAGQGSAFPVGDWQFWVATILAVAAVGWLVRGFVPWRRILRRPDKKRGRRATLTLERMPLDGSKRKADLTKGGPDCH